MRRSTLIAHRGVPWALQPRRPRGDESPALSLVACDAASIDLPAKEDSSVDTAAVAPGASPR